MKDDKVYIQHILESIELIEQYVAEKADAADNKKANSLYIINH
jgi:uncharacterized protein with HEPN domain